MKPIIILNLIFTLFCINLHAQITLIIDELKVSDIKPDIKLDINSGAFDEDEFDGPYIHLKCLLINDGDKKIDVFPSKSKMVIKFNYKGENFEDIVVAMPFSDQEKLEIKEKTSVEISFGTRLLLGTELWSEKKENYCEILLGLLPTISVVYKDPNLNCPSIGINKVTLIN